MISTNQKTQKLNLQPLASTSKIIFLLLILIMPFMPMKAYAKTKGFKNKTNEVITDVKKIEDKGNSILKTAKHLGAHGTTFDHVVQVFNSLKKYTNKFENSWSGIEGLKGKINNTIGVLKIPDPFQAADEIIKVFTKQRTNSNGIDPGIKGENASKEFNRDYTYGQSDSVLGKGGQKVQLEESKNTQSAVEVSRSEAEHAQSDTITQDILKRISIQTLQAQKIQKSLQKEEQQQTRLAAVADMNLADISGNLDKERREKQIERENYRKEILGTATFNDAFWDKKQ